MKIKTNKKLQLVGNFIKDMFKIDENQKASTIMALLLVSFSVGMWAFINSNPHTIDSNFVTLILGFAGIVATINIGNSIFNPTSPTTEQTENKEEV